MYPLAGVTCERCGEWPAQNRHHVDRNTRNNDRSNIELLCRSCHKRQHPEQWFTPEMTARGRAAREARAAAITHCPAGHEYTPENTYLQRNTLNGTVGRVCRVCRARRLRELRAAAWIKTGRAYKPR
jgi:hypothetical protein